MSKLELVETVIGKNTPTVEVDMDAPCESCDEMGRTPNGLCLSCTSKNLSSFPPPEFKFAENQQEFAPAVEAEMIGRKLVRKHHHWLDDADVQILYVFIKNSPVKGGKEVLGRARKITGLNAWLSLPEQIRANVTKPEAFFLIEISWSSWQYLEDRQKEALVDHELAHCAINEKGEPSINGHDCEEFFSVVSRHGQWSTDVRLMVEAAKEAENRPLFSRA